ncbi:MAG: preprotein translocase subunit YajC [Gammaproteobacteria bacterium RIFCSPHIGHO2_12_FULL_42_13]|nr:MAG: preprotein translocase subunit YajC [Gammaproteobacteria bacterium RIFCSPHIGHO2_12_FULL_42_13]
MSLLSLLGISTAYAAETAAATTPPPQGGFLSVLPLLIVFILISYFLLIRPQSKRAKQQRQLLSSLSVGDEILTTGGIIGRITKLRDNYLALSTGKEIEMIFQKNAVAAVLPKGTMATMD